VTQRPAARSAAGRSCFDRRRSPLRRAARNLFDSESRLSYDPAVRRRVVLPALALLALAAPVAATMLVQRLPLARVTRAAARIVHGRIVAVDVGRDDSGLPATWITVDIARAVKGGPASRLTIKQYGVATPLPDGTLAAIAGMPRYAPGEELVLFLHGESRRGFTSPVGLGQGVYRVRRHGDAADVRDDLGHTAPQPLDDFLGRVAHLAETP